MAAWAQKPATRHTRLTRAAAGKKPQQPATPPPQAQPPAPVPPPVPLRPEQMPPTLPQVTYQNNQLTIVANNATLSAILWAVRARTGANIEMPPDAASERVAVQLGPGSPREVLEQLLDGSRFDYIIMGSDTNPGAVSQVMLTRRGNAAPGSAPGSPPAAVAAGSSAPQPPSRMQPPQMPPEQQDEEAEPPEPTPAPPVPATGQVQPTPIPPTQISPQTPGSPGASQPNSAQPNTGQPNQVKTPEQLLQELQQMQRQQQQQQQQGQRPPHPPPD